MSMFKKVFLLVSSVVCGAVGVTIIVLGTQEILSRKYIENFAKEHRYITAVFISLGVIIVLISAIGFFGVILQNSVLLRVYAYLMLTLVVVQVSIGFTILLLVDKLRSAMYKRLEEAYKHYDINKEIIDRLQVTLKCCGMVGSRNWNVTLPASCCGLRNGSCAIESAYVDSCANKTEEQLLFGLYVVSIGLLIVVLFEIKCIILACCLSSMETAEEEQPTSVTKKRNKRSSEESSVRSSSSTSSSDEDNSKNK